VGGNYSCARRTARLSGLRHITSEGYTAALANDPCRFPTKAKSRGRLITGRTSARSFSLLFSPCCGAPRNVIFKGGGGNNFVLGSENTNDRLGCNLSPKEFPCNTGPSKPHFAGSEPGAYYGHYCCRSASTKGPRVGIGQAWRKITNRIP